MSLALPSLTAYDPATVSEGTLDPLGLYQIADQLGSQLVPAVRERMQRIRFLTAMAVGASVTETMDVGAGQNESAPHLIWEWMLIQAFVSSQHDEGALLGVPGTLVARRAVATHGYLDARSYLKTPRVFGFHGVYKRLAVHLGLVDADLRLLPAGEELVDAWARDLDQAETKKASRLLDRWRIAVERSQGWEPCRTDPPWGKKSGEWEALAAAFLPDDCGKREKRLLRNMLRQDGERSLGALREIWDLHVDGGNDEEGEETLHVRLSERLPSAKLLLAAVAAYERFCRSLEDGFDLIRAVASLADTQGFDVTSIRADEDFQELSHGLDRRFVDAHAALETLDPAMSGLVNDRFVNFAQPATPAETAVMICQHHESIQKDKSVDGKRPWFDRLGGNRIYVRHRYRIERREIRPGRYVHDYRRRPIRQFARDLT